MYHQIPEPPAHAARVLSYIVQTQSVDVPTHVLNQAALLLLDTLGICIAATPMESAVIARDTACLLFSSAKQSHQSRLLFDGRIASIAGAVFAAATQIDNLDGHDGYNPTKGHIGVAVVPALAALAENEPSLSGKEALTSLVMSYEVAGRAAISLHASVTDYHTSGAWNGLGVAAMAARLRKQDTETLRQALGIAEYHGPRSQMMREIANPTMLHDGSGMGAMTGIKAAIMAENGFTGAPAITLESIDAETHWADLGTFWQVDHQYIKPYPICRWAHAAIDAVSEICTEHLVEPGNIQEVIVRSFNNAVALFPTMPSTTSEAQYSLSFSVATMLVHRHIGLEQISGSGLSDPAVAAMVERITLVAESKHEQRFPEGRWADVDIVLLDGHVLSSGDVHASGGPERPYQPSDVIEKYMDFSVPVLGHARAAHIRDAVLNLNSENSLFSELSEHLFAAPTQMPL